MMDVLTLPIRKTSTWAEPTVECSDLDVFADADHVQVDATWGHLPAHHRGLPRRRESSLGYGHRHPQHRGAPVLTELITLGRILRRRASDILAYFDRPGTLNGPTEAINGRLEHLPGTSLGFRNLTGRLLDTGGFRPRYTLFCGTPIGRSHVVMAGWCLAVPGRSSRNRCTRYRPRPGSAIGAGRPPRPGSRPRAGGGQRQPPSKGSHPARRRHVKVPEVGTFSGQV